MLSLMLMHHRLVRSKGQALIAVDNAQDPSWLQRKGDAQIAGWQRARVEYARAIPLIWKESDAPICFFRDMNIVFGIPHKTKDREARLAQTKDKGDRNMTSMMRRPLRCCRALMGLRNLSAI